MPERKPLPPPRTLLVTAADREQIEKERPQAFHLARTFGRFYGGL